MDAMKRAMSFNEAKAKGMIFGDYDYKGLPEEFTANIRYKVWGKNMNLQLFLVDEEDNQKYCLSIFRNRDSKFYSPRKMPDLDLASVEIQPGTRLLLKTQVTRNGNSNLLEAKVL